ncbi:LrgB family protein [Pseudoalteromonas aurantia]|nr:LrgB family protein [Pseudoalteromonas aurantia]
MSNLLLISGLTIALFFLCRALYKRIPTPLLNPVLTTICISSTILLALDIRYIDYKAATMPINFFLELAVVSLAYPIYMQFRIVKKSLLLLISSSFTGVSVATVGAYFLCLGFNASPNLTASLAALSVTTPISLIVTESLNGLPAVAAIMVILIGVFGGVFGLHILSFLAIDKPQAKGVALGVSCHAIGTATAIEYHPQAGVFASAAMTISALITAFWVPILYKWLTKFTLLFA